MKMITPEFFTRLLINLKPVKPEHARQKLNPQTASERTHLPITQAQKAFRKMYANAYALSCNARVTCTAYYHRHNLISMSVFPITHAAHHPRTPR